MILPGFFVVVFQSVFFFTGTAACSTQLRVKFDICIKMEHFRQKNVFAHLTDGNMPTPANVMTETIKTIRGARACKS